ncbi:MAG: hypothetical protein RBJ76_01075 [Stenomitos frigidus ULC029]
MPFIQAGEASEANRSHLANIQSLMELLLLLATKATDQQQPPKAEEKEKKEEEANLTADPVADESVSLADQLEQDLAQTELSKAVVQLDCSKSNGVAYQAEGFAIMRYSDSTSTLYEVTTPEGESLLTFERLGTEFNVLENRLPDHLKDSLLSASERLKTNDLVAVQNNPDPAVVMKTMGEAAPAGTRAAWVTQQMLQGRDSFTPTDSNFKFEREPSGTLTVTDHTNRQILLQVAPQGKVTCTMNAGQVEQFKPAYDRLQTFAAGQRTAGTAKAAGKAAAKTKGGVALVRER